MTAEELLTDLQQRGVTITAESGRLRIRAPKGTITPELRDRLAAHKPDIIAALAMPTRPELDAICKRACRDYPDVQPERLRRFLEVAEDPGWTTARAARQLAKRMHEGLITWRPGDE